MRIHTLFDASTASAGSLTVVRPAIRNSAGEGRRRAIVPRGPRLDATLRVSPATPRRGSTCADSFTGRQGQWRLPSLRSELASALQGPDAADRCAELLERAAAERAQPLRDQLAEAEARIERAETLASTSDSRVSALLVDLRKKESLVETLLTDLRMTRNDLRAKDQQLTKTTASLEQRTAAHTEVTARLREASTDLLHERGKLHMRGVLEYIEEQEGERIGYPFNTARPVKWEFILSRHPGLVQCLLQDVSTSTRGKGPDYEVAARMMPRIYSALSMRHHPIISPESTQGAKLLTMNDDGQDTLYMSMLSCLCKHYHLSYARVRASGKSSEQYDTTMTGLPEFTQQMPDALDSQLTLLRDKAAKRLAREGSAVSGS